MLKRLKYGKKNKYGKALLYTKKALLYRILSKNNYLLGRIGKLIIRVPRVLSKIVKNCLDKTSLLIPPKLIKQYISSIGNNMSNETIEENIICH